MRRRHSTTFWLEKRPTRRRASCPAFTMLRCTRGCCTIWTTAQCCGSGLKDILFTTKAMGVGIGLKDRGVKHIFIDQWNPLEIAQSLGRKRSLDADDTCTVYFRDYSLDWYWGTNSGLKKFHGMLLNKYLPAQAYMAGEEEFNKYLHSDNPEVIQKKSIRVKFWNTM